MKDDNEFFEDEEVEKVENSNTLASIYYENKKLIWILIIVIILILLMLIFGKSNNSNNGNNNTKEDVTTVTISSRSETISVNNTKQLSVVVNTNDNPINNPTIIWTSSDNNVAIVDNNGLIRGLKEGNAIITATYKDKKDVAHTSTCNVTVISSSGTEGVKLLSVKFKEGTIIMAPNSTYNLYYEKEPFNGMVTSTIYSSTNEAVAKVNQDGQVTGVSVGTGTIKLNVNNGVTASINIQVIDRQVTPGIYVLPSSLSFKESAYELTVGEGKKLSYNNAPNNANLTFIEFSSNNSKVATVDNTGFVRGVSAGDATITISCGSVSATTVVHVKNKTIDVSKVNVTDNNINLNVAGVYQIKAEISPSDATDKSLSYTSNNTKVVTVNEKGQVTAVGSGSTYVTVTSNSNKYASVNVFFKVSGGSSGGGSGSSGSGGSSGGSSTGVATVKITSDNNAVQVSYNNAVNQPRKTYPTITITPTGNYTSIKYCTYTYGTNESCTPNTTYNGPFELRKTGITVIKARAIYNGKEGETLTRYVNIKVNDPSNPNSCYCNTNGTCNYGKSNSSYSIDVNLTEGLCEAYINRGNIGCFVNNGNYIWGSYLGKSSSYVYMGSITSESSCRSSGGSPVGPTGSFHVNWGKSYGYNLGLDSVRIFEFKVSSTANINRIYFCESQNSTKCVIDINSATKKTKHFDLRVLSGSTYDTGSTYNKTFYFEDLSGTNFTFYLVTEKGHSVTLLATDSNKRTSESFSTTAQ